MSNEQYISDRDFKKAVQKIAGTSQPQGNTQNINSQMSAPGSGSATTGQPSHINEIPIGIRYGYIRRIDLNPKNEFRYEVIFPDANSKVWARKIGTLGIKIPKGKMLEGYYYFDQQIPVALIIDYNSFTWSIISQPDDIPFELIEDSLVIPYGDSKIIIENDSVDIISPSILHNGNKILDALDYSLIQTDFSDIDENISTINGNVSTIENNIISILATLETKLDVSNYTATDVLDKLKTVDGAGSLLDADLWDGHQYSEVSGSITSLTGNISDIQTSLSNLNTLISEKVRYASTTVANVTGGSAGTVDVTISAQPSLAKCVCFTTGSNSAKIQVSSTSGSTYTIRYIFDSNGTNRTIYVLYFT